MGVACRNSFIVRITSNCSITPGALKASIEKRLTGFWARAAQVELLNLDVEEYEEPRPKMKKIYPKKR